MIGQIQRLSKYIKCIYPLIVVFSPELVGKTAMEIYDATVKSLTDQGLIVILNNHIRYLVLLAMIVSEGRVFNY